MKKQVNYPKAILRGIFVFLFVFSGIVLQAQEESRAVSGFDKVSYSLPGQLQISQGSSESLLLKGDKNDLSEIITEVEGGELKIYTKEHGGHLGNVVVIVNLKNLKELSAAGSGNVIFKTGVQTSELEMNLSGSGSVECMDMKASKAEISLSGSGDINLGGVLNSELELNIAGSGNIKADDLQAKSGEVNLSGSGSAYVWITDNLESNIAGSGEVYYKGNPLLESSVHGSGSINSIK
jgi:hypothetical protein